MKMSFFERATQFINEQRKHTYWLAVVACLAMVVMTGTVYALIRQGQASVYMEKTLVCPVTVHAHSADCYDEEGRLICGYADYVVHTHNDDCYDANSNLVCPLKEMEEHVHDSSCWEVREELVCGLEENPGHQHTEACWAPGEACPLEEHVHTDECYEAELVPVGSQTLSLEGGVEEAVPVEEGADSAAYGEDTSGAPADPAPQEEPRMVEVRRLVCGKEEHTHDESCQGGPVLICGLEEGEGSHVHGPECYQETEVLACGKNELHTHTAECYDEAGRLVCGKLELHAHVHDENCFLVRKLDPDEVADLPPEEPPEPETPDAPGGEENPPASSDHTGEVLICGMEEHAHGGDCIDASTLELICGKTVHIHTEECWAKETAEEPEEPPIDWKCGKAEHVHEGLCYDIYGTLICPLEEHIHSDACLTEGETSFILTAEAEGSGGVRVIVSGAGSVLPCPLENVTLTARQLPKDDPTAEKADSLIKAALEEAGPNENAEIQTVKETTYFEISLWCNGEEIEPTGALRLAFANLPGKKAEDEELEVFHVDTVAEETADMGAQVDEEGNLALDTDHFSFYGVVTTAATVSIEEGLEREDKDYHLTLTGITTLKTDVTVKGSKTLDLNGQKLLLNGNLTVGSGATLTIENSTAAQDTVTLSSPASVENAGRLASYTDDTLTYYVTKSASSGGPGCTAETLETHTVSNAGMIVCGEGGSIQVSGGTLNLEGGYITGAKNSAAVHAISGTINLSGTVIAGNKQGINLKDNSTLTMTGGVISGNGEATLGGNEATDGAKGGGGIYATNSTLYLSGGYLTNNQAQKGGGLYVHQEHGGGTAELSGSLQITGNYAREHGGGVMLDRCECQINGGFISQNRAETAEGGGIRIDFNASCIVRAGYITNNKTNTQEHWGGGGIFCAKGSRLLVQDALITHNKAGGFGGGVAGCSTGRLMIVAAAGAAIYDNTDHPDGKPHLSGNASTKDADHTFWEKDEVFRENGCDDYFCALSSVIDGSMLGGGSANWSGSADGVAYENVGRGQTLTAGRVMGLTADPSEADQQHAANSARVYITGNYSYTHGGGILNNGYMVIGETKEFEIPKGVTLTMQKDVLTNEGVQRPEKGVYQFEVTDANGKVIRTVTNDGDGAIQFSFDYGKDDLAGVQEGGTRDFTYYVREIVPEDPDPQMTYDPSVYRVVVTVIWETSKEEISFQQGSSSIKKCIYRPKEVKVYKGSSEEPLDTVKLGYEETETQTVDLTQTAKFVNSSKKAGVTSVTVMKVWSDGNEKHSDASVTVQLLQNGKEYEQSVTLDNSNGWSYKWENLPLSAENGENYTYTVKESNVPDGYVASYETDSDFMEGGCFVPATGLEAGGKYIIVSPDGDYALKTTWDHRDIPFNETDKADIRSAKGGDGQLEIGGTSYNDWYTAKDIINSDASVYEAQPSQYGRFSLVCKVRNPDNHQTVNSWLALGGEGGVHLKGTKLLSWNSPFWIQNGRLCGGINNKKYEDSHSYYQIQYINNVFDNSQSQESANAAKVYRWVGDYNASSTITITNTPASEVPYTLELTKTNEDETRSLGGAAFQLIVMEEGAIKTNEDGTPVTLKFDSNGVGSYSVTDGHTAVLDAITTDQGGKLVVTGIPAGTYTLREVTPPPGYTLAEDKVLTFNEETAADHKLKVPVKDKLLVLPMTGGPGITVYALGGTLLAAVAGSLLYSKRTRRKGGVDQT